MQTDIFIPVDTEELTPLVEFKVDGNLRIEGRSYPENPVKFFEPLINWLKEYKTNPPASIIMTLRLEYFNTSTSKIVLFMLKIIEDVHYQYKIPVNIVWQFNKNDEDMFESGKDYQSLIDLPFEFVGYE